jgi:hypothetical protein
MAPFPLGILAASGGGVENLPVYELISTIQGGGGVSALEITSIPQTYTHLRLEISGRSTAATDERDVQIQFNGDTGSNYSWSGHGYRGAGSKHEYTFTSSAIAIYSNIAGNNNAANIHGNLSLEMLHYTSTNRYKGIFGHTNLIANYFRNMFASGTWKSNSAVTSIKINTPETLYSNSSFSLYGIRVK